MKFLFLVTVTLTLTYMTKHHDQ